MACPFGGSPPPSPSLPTCTWTIVPGPMICAPQVFAMDSGHCESYAPFLGVGSGGYDDGATCNYGAYAGSGAPFGTCGPSAVWQRTLECKPSSPAPAPVPVPPPPPPPPAPPTLPASIPGASTASVAGYTSMCLPLFVGNNAAATEALYDFSGGSNVLNQIRRVTSTGSSSLVVPTWFIPITISCYYAMANIEDMYWGSAPQYAPTEVWPNMCDRVFEQSGGWSATYSRPVQRIHTYIQTGPTQYTLSTITVDAINKELLSQGPYTGPGGPPTTVSSCN